ncbi:MAG: RNA polymerase sigma factor [Patescibacteria group bacterium]|nr:RNA polymerase sigma factor [Patescibacteria group bacterium]MDE1965744.1 RNA polymerase sigma factor [Patescibacteria group bacterium]
MHRDPEQAFEKAFEEYADALFRHASFRIASRERAADLAQDTFIKAWNFVAGGGEVRHWKSFLYRILNNLVVDEYRRVKEESLDALYERDAAAVRGAALGSRAETEAALDDERDAQLIREQLPRLPDQYRVAVTLRYIDGFSPKEIAALLDVSENVVSVRIHRGVARLKRFCEAKRKNHE